MYVSGGHGRDRNKRRRIELIRTADVDLAVPERFVVLEGSVQELAREVSKLVGSYQNQVVFFQSTALALHLGDWDGCEELQEAFVLAEGLDWFRDVELEYPE